MKRTSRIFSTILALIMIISALPISASATDVKFTATSSVNDIKAGDTVTINVGVSDNSNIHALTVDVVYDSSKLEYVSYELYGTGGSKVVNPSYAEGKFRYVYVNDVSDIAGGTFLSIQFTALESSCNAVSIDIVESSDKDLNSISATAVPVTIHSYGEWITGIEPACETEGQRSKSCTCGDKIYESINALGHDYATEFTTDTEPKCTEMGSKSQHCSRCDSKQNVTEIPAKGHDFSEWITETEPTCTIVGKENRICSACGETETQDISATGHTEEEIPAVNSTCTETGLTAGMKCSVCGEILTEQTVVPATGHDYKMEITKIPTHTENGEKKFTCNNCGDTHTEIIVADGDHKHISAVTKEVTCTEKGVMTYTCACGDSYTEEISALGHTSADTVEENYVAPNCTDKGSKDKVVYCSVCDEELSRETVEINALGHTEEELYAAAPTCTETGLTAGEKCSVCGEILVAQEEIPANGHKVNDDGYCDTCDEKICDHNCHKSGISGFFWKIANFFNKLFGTKKYCECGLVHY